MDDCPDCRIASRVDRGVELLDARLGYSWRERVDLTRLDMADPEKCILGQLKGGYSRVLDEWGISSVDSTDGAYYGFDVDNNYYDESYEELAYAWRRHIREV